MYISKDFMVGMCAIIITMGFAYATQADVVVDDGTKDAFFMVDGHKASGLDASKAAETSGRKIQRCTPIKNSFTQSGEPAYKCPFVVKHINPKNGNTTWKNQ